MKWISIEKKIPEYIEGEEQIFIVAGIDDMGKRYVYWAQAYTYGYTEIHNRIFSVPGWSEMGVTHWMPLPKHPDK